MKIIFIVLASLLFSKETKTPATLRSGDIIFQTTSSMQCKAVQLATHSIYSHCGIIDKRESGYYVCEAVQPVKYTPLKEWIEGGQGSHYVVKRLKNADKALTTEVLKCMKETEEKYKGKDYDAYFGWTDDKIYCSELIWKVYKSCLNIEVGKPQLLKDFDLSNPLVKKELEKRYGSKIPYNEQVVSPATLFESDLLEEVVKQ